MMCLKLLSTNQHKTHHFEYCLVYMFNFVPVFLFHVDRLSGYSDINNTVEICYKMAQVTTMEFSPILCYNLEL